MPYLPTKRMFVSDVIVTSEGALDQKGKERKCEKETLIGHL
jgi:hypothetical protein